MPLKPETAIFLRKFSIITSVFVTSVFLSSCMTTDRKTFRSKNTSLGNLEPRADLKLFSQEEQVKLLPPKVESSDSSTGQTSANQVNIAASTAAPSSSVKSNEEVSSENTQASLDNSDDEGDDNDPSLADNSSNDGNDIDTADSDEKISEDSDGYTAYLNSISSLMCEDSVYYRSWVQQFNAAWLVQNRKVKFKNAKLRTRALDKSRVEAFIQLVYPAIEKTGYDFPSTFNPQVLGWINYFTGKGRNNFVVWLRRGQNLIPQMQEKLEQNGLPKDLVYLSMIESGFSNKALSVVGAVGPWQFMPFTARRYGLKINDWVDERRDPAKATEAAAKYLTDLYSLYGSWYLAAGAYNCGEGCINRTLRKYGRTQSYFELTSKGAINSQTANYVPKILAAMIISKNPELFGFETADLPTALVKTKTLEVRRSILLKDLAGEIGVDPEFLTNLNPQLRAGLTPPESALNGGVFAINIPETLYEKALASVDSLPEASQNHIYHARIKRRETLQAFARRYKLNTETLLAANTHIRNKSAALRTGEVLYVPVSLGSGQLDRLTTVKYTKKKHHVRKASFKKKKYFHRKSIRSFTQSKMKKQLPKRVASK